MPGEWSSHTSLPVWRLTAMKLGASGTGTLMCASSTPWPVVVKTRSPTTSGLPAAWLCGKTSSSAIMSSFHTTSSSISLVSVSSLNGPSFSPSRKPSTSAATSSARLLTYQRRSPSTCGPSQMPCSGQSLTRPAESLGYADCQRNLPVSASNTMRLARSPCSLGLRRPSLLVPA